MSPPPHLADYTSYVGYHGVSFFISLFVAGIFSYVIIIVSRRFNLLATPTQERWHRIATPLFGGVAIFFGSIAGLIYQLSLATELTFPISYFVHSSNADIFYGSFLLIFVIGLVDDVVGIAPWAKLFLQIIAATLFSLSLDFSTLFLLPFVAFWLVFISNGTNLIDNIDGLAGGSSLATAVSLLSLGIFFDLFALTTHSAILSGALIGFLVFNLHPAQIFMGDSGSLFLGFLLAALSIIFLSENATLEPVLTILLIFTLPIFDTIFVSLRRVSERRSIFKGGKDHTSHILVNYGFSNRRAVGILLTTAAIINITALSLLILLPFLVPYLFFIVIFSSVCFGLFLAKSKTSCHS